MANEEQRGSADPNSGPLRRYVDKCRTCVLRAICGFGSLSREDREDILQDTWIRVGSTVRTIPGISCAYAIRVATNRAIDVLRNRKLFSWAVDDENFKPAVASQSVAIRYPELQLYFEAVRAVQEHPRKIERMDAYLLHFHEHRSAQEIAAEKHKTVNAIRVLITKGRKDVLAVMLQRVNQLIPRSIGDLRAEYLRIRARLTRAISPRRREGGE